MTINSISGINNNQNINFGHGHSRKSKEPVSPLERSGVLATTLVGVGASLALIAKKQGFSLSPSKIAQTPIKDWAIFKTFNKQQPDRKLLELEEKEILTLAGGSVAGGLAGGLMFDKKHNRKAKFKEALNQLLGNVLVPVACVGGASRLYDKYKKQILSLVPQINIKNLTDNKLKTAKFINKFLKILPSAGITLAALGTGIVAGNKVSNFINEKVYHKKVERKIKGTDFAPHVDDLGMAITLMADKSFVSTLITKTVPAFLCVPGFETGTAKEN